MYRLTAEQLARRRERIAARRGPPPPPGTVPPPARFPKDWIRIEKGEHSMWRFFATNIADLPPHCSDPRCRRARICQHWEGPCQVEQHPWYQPQFRPFLDWVDELHTEARARGIVLPGDDGDGPPPL